ncbi:hypothetical protein EV426DRAFT_706316 [Tirmania nivea]|nr:hypothetical protein EV426DRAFT_706316 [Tirmania nivea]
MSLIAVTRMIRTRACSSVPSLVKSEVPVRLSPRRDFSPPDIRREWGGEVEHAGAPATIMSDIEMCDAGDNPRWEDEIEADATNQAFDREILEYKDPKKGIKKKGRGPRK